jgi:D-3-phosphoglycerate dehydrogenase / 2-oxoglutarate reductase
MIPILLNEPSGFPTTAIERLQRLGPVYRSDADYPAESIQVVFVRLREHIGAEFLRCHPALRVVVSPTTGLNHLDVALLVEAGIEVISLKGRTVFLDHIYATAEHTLALALALIRRLPAANRDVLAGTWNRYPFQGSELHGKTVLLLGYGRIGRQVHALYSAFGCRLLACDAIEDRVPTTLRCELPSALAQADILSIHVNLEPGTHGLVDAALLDQLRPCATVVNTSRGEIIDQTALLERVADGRLGGAALDVLIGEPVPLTPSVRAQIDRCGPRLVVTPHIAGFTTESLSTVEQHVTDLLLEAVEQL